MMKSIGILVLILITIHLNGQRMEVEQEWAQKARNLEASFATISAERKLQLTELAEAIGQHLKRKGDAEVTFICTHNSRRSQLSELWLRAACEYYKVEGVRTYSGGTEATAFNPRMVAAIERYGFAIKQMTEGSNPRYEVSISATEEARTMYSKKYDHPSNPSEDFIAVMVCDQADEDCPIVQGAADRISLPYLDPKAFDGTDQETQAYDDKVKEIGVACLYVAKILRDMQ